MHSRQSRGCATATPTTSSASSKSRSFSRRQRRALPRGPMTRTPRSRKRRFRTRRRRPRHRTSEKPTMWTARPILPRCSRNSCVVSVVVPFVNPFPFCLFSSTLSYRFFSRFLSNPNAQFNSLQYKTREGQFSVVWDREKEQPQLFSHWGCLVCTQKKRTKRAKPCVRYQRGCMYQSVGVCMQITTPMSR